MVRSDAPGRSVLVAAQDSAWRWLVSFFLRDYGYGVIETDRLGGVTARAAVERAVGVVVDLDGIDPDDPWHFGRVAGDLARSGLPMVVVGTRKHFDSAPTLRRLPWICLVEHPRSAEHLVEALETCLGAACLTGTG